MGGYLLGLHFEDSADNARKILPILITLRSPLRGAADLMASPMPPTPYKNTVKNIKQLLMLFRVSELGAPR